MTVTVRQLQQWKQQGRPIAALTASDWAIARVLDGAGVDLILVGDSLAMVALGHATTLPLTLDDIIHHAKAVVRGTQRALVAVDLPFLTYQESPTQALRSAGRVLQETGAHAVKLEGGSPSVVAAIAKLTECGIPAIAHLGLTPQAVHRLGYRRQGTDPAGVARLQTEAAAVAAAGAIAVVLEHMPAPVAQTLTQALTIPTLGIGAGPHCDGQILVTHDLLGWSPVVPPFVKTYAAIGDIMRQAVQAYCQDVQSRHFPEDKP
ncbi:MAG TPA: 3-methyl-2-oxobutanoate hydroxymethyltransferase [Cyanobacteria bacterium UBA8156]|nr:3-methyl-2-oxobutanoate hydroxymethyltransferase [Cyanobacteria bacterium UBA8156]